MELNLLNVGDRVPEFEAFDEQGNLIRLRDYKGKKLIVFFYPRANTPGCTEEGCNLRDHYAGIRDKGYEILGVSEDSQRKQSNFKKKFSFPFPLVADTEHAVIDAFGVWGPKKFMGREFDGIHRKTFVINEEGIVVQRVDKVVTKDHAAQLELT